MKGITRKTRKLYRSGRARNVKTGDRWGQWLVHGEAGREYGPGGIVWHLEHRRTGERILGRCKREKGRERIHRVRRADLVPRAFVETFTVWDGIVARCERKGSGAYGRYGGRGVSLFRLWSPTWYPGTLVERRRRAFHAFLADKGIRPGPDYDLDRKDAFGDYDVLNTRWIVRSHHRVFGDRRSRRAAMAA